MLSQTFIFKHCRKVRERLIELIQIPLGNTWYLPLALHALLSGNEKTYITEISILILIFE